MYLTDPLVEQAAPRAATFLLWDEAMKGFGIKINSGGTKTFILQYRMGGRSTRTRRVTIGRFPMLKCEPARRKAADIKLLIASGKDPAADAPVERRAVPAATADGDVRGSSARIHAAARRVFLREGYGLSISSVAQEAGASRQTIYDLFGTKRELIRTISSVLVEELDNQALIIDRRAPFEEALLKLAHQYVEGSTNVRSLQIQRMLMSANEGYEDIGAQLFAAGSIRLIRKLSDYLAHHIQIGTIADQDVQLAAEFFFGAVIGQSRFRGFLGVKEDPRQRNRYIAAAVKRFLVSLHQLQFATTATATE